MALERELARLKKKYHFKTKRGSEEWDRTELAFLAMLDHLFKNAPGAEAAIAKRKLNILDVGCGSMPYAFPLKLFFEGPNGKREASITGIDTDLGAAFAEIDIERRGLKGVRIERVRLNDLNKGGYDVITCFNSQSSELVGFYRKMLSLLADEGLLLISFDSENEFRQDEQAIKDAGVDLFHIEKNQFAHFFARIMFHSAILCLARKKG